MPATRHLPCLLRRRHGSRFVRNRSSRYESGVVATPDPLAGSYYVETLTDQLEQAANDYLAQIDAMGGAIKAIDAGFQQREIQEAAYRSSARSNRVTSGRRSQSLSRR